MAASQSLIDLRWAFLDDLADQVASTLDREGYPATRELQKVREKLLRTGHNERERIFWICVKYYGVRRRKIQPAPRTVLRSPELNALSLTTDQSAALDRIESDSRSGADLTPYLSTRISALGYNDAFAERLGHPPYASRCL
jgi:hypothetical protein